MSAGSPAAVRSNASFDLSLTIWTGIYTSDFVRVNGRPQRVSLDGVNTCPPPTGPVLLGHNPLRMKVWAKVCRFPIGLAITPRLVSLALNSLRGTSPPLDLIWYSSVLADENRWVTPPYWIALLWVSPTCFDTARLTWVKDFPAASLTERKLVPGYATNK